jgi:hypothetical protein
LASLFVGEKLDVFTAVDQTNYVGVATMKTKEQAFLEAEKYIKKSALAGAGKKRSGHF